jgi:hypothetical protein
LLNYEYYLLKFESSCNHSTPIMPNPLLPHRSKTLHRLQNYTNPWKSDPHPHGIKGIAYYCRTSRFHQDQGNKSTKSRRLPLNLPPWRDDRRDVIGRSVIVSAIAGVNPLWFGARSFSPRNGVWRCACARWGCGVEVGGFINGIEIGMFRGADANNIRISLALDACKPLRGYSSTCL